MNPNIPPSGAVPTFGIATTSAAPSTGFGFGAPGATSTAFAPPSFGSSANTGFSFGAAKPATTTTGASTGFSLTTPASGTGGFNFGLNTTPSTAASAAPSVGFSFPGAAPTSTATAPAGGTTASSFLPAAPAQSTAGTTFSIPTASTAPTGFSFPAASAATTATGFSLNPSTTATSNVATGFSLPSAAAAVSSAAATSAAVAPPPAFNLATSASTGFSLGAGLTPAAGANTTASNQSLAPTSTATATSAAETVSTSLVGAKNSVSFAQLDDNIHKWTLELVELERVFLNQMDQVRDWDRLLLSTGDKIVGLNSGMEKVKLRQQQLDHELDFIVAQQKELVECLVTLEKEFASVTVSDPERNSVYQRAENLNTQLQQISEDLKGVIEHINERNKSQDTSDPIVQIGRILNAHMNSLQWVDQNTTVVQNMLDQVGKMRDIHRRDADSTQNL